MDGQMGVEPMESARRKQLGQVYWILSQECF